MQIVHVCLCGAVTDGFSYQDNLLPKYHKKNGHDVSIITSKWVWGKNGKLTRDNREDYINQDDVRIIRLEMYGKDDFNKKFKKYKNLYETIDSLKPDILFIHGVSFRDTVVVKKYLKKNHNVIAYADNHADWSNSATNWVSKNILHRIIWRYYARKLIPYVKKFYGVLPIRVDFLIQMYNIPKEKCELLVMGADDELVVSAKADNVREKIRKKYEIKDDDFFIITGGKIDAWKTQTLLLMQAINNIKDEKIKLIIFGSIDENLKDQVYSLLDEKRIQYIGWIESKDSYPLIASADLAVFPGRHSVLWEQTAALGIPMLVKDWVGTHHVDLGGNVDFLTEDSIEGIERKIKSIVYGNDKYKLMKKVAEEGKNTFSYKQIAKRSIGE